MPSLFYTHFWGLWNSIFKSFSPIKIVECFFCNLSLSPNSSGLKSSHFLSLQISVHIFIFFFCKLSYIVSTLISGVFHSAWVFWGSSMLLGVSIIVCHISFIHLFIGRYCLYFLLGKTVIKMWYKSEYFSFFLGKYPGVEWPGYIIDVWCICNFERLSHFPKCQY